MSHSMTTQFASDLGCKVISIVEICQVLHSNLRFKHDKISDHEIKDYMRVLEFALKHWYTNEDQYSAYDMAVHNLICATLYERKISIRNV